MSESGQCRRARRKGASFRPAGLWGLGHHHASVHLWSALAPKNMETMVNAVFKWTTEGWGWLYLLTVFLLVVGCFVLMVTKFGTLKLGLKGDKPEFSNFAWFAMLFGAAIAAGIVFWGPAEPAYHYMTPPPYFGGEAKTAEAAPTP